MGRTSIDGLTVRSARSSKPSGTAAPRPKTKTTVRTRRTTDITRPTATRKRKVTADEDFLSPVEGLDLSEVNDNDFTDASSDDWSELLNEFGDKKLDNSDDLGLAQEDSLLDEAAEEPSKKPKKDKKGKKGKDGKPKKKHKVRRRILTTLLLLLIVAGVVFFIWGDSIIARLTNGNSGLWDVIGSMMSETVPFETDEHGRTNVLVFGTEGYNMNGDVGNTQHEGADLTDSIMVISFDQETKDVALLSIPRDLKVSQACGWRIV